jgi:hypothetical protein
MPLHEREDVVAPRRAPRPGRPPLRTDSADAVPVERRLPVHRGKVGRITDQLAGLSEDVREIVELRIQLVKREVMEQVEGRISSVKGQAIVGALAALTGVFLLLSLALGLGMLLGHAFWGFLIVSGLFVVATLIAKKKFMPGAVRVEHDKKTGKVRLAVEETPAEYESRKTVEDGHAHPPHVT